jgi:hypothetical protein
LGVGACDAVYERFDITKYTFYAGIDASHIAMRLVNIITQLL